MADKLKTKNQNLEPNSVGAQVQDREIVQEMEESYLAYAMSVIVARALPDVRDGLKPVHRRILYAMNEMGLRPGAKVVKSAKIVGQTMANYHPHGDIAIYDSLVRMAQDFSLRYPFVHGQGNWGCFTGDTKVSLTDGRAVSFVDLVKESKKGKKNFTYTFNNDTESVEIAEIKNPRLTRKDAPLVEVVLDNGEKIKCTPDHRFMLRDGSYCEAQFLKNGQSLMPSYFRLSTKEDDKHAVGYKMIWQPVKNIWDWAYRLADQWNIKNSVYSIKDGRVRHHLDFNKLNNDPINLKRMQWADHWRLHYQLASERHKNDSEYVARLKKGRESYWSKAENKAKKQWQDPLFRKRVLESSKQARSKFLEENPDFMAEITEKAKQSLTKKWQDSSYKERVVKSKVLGFVNGLMAEQSSITPELYEQKRKNNGVPRLEKALNYFPNFQEIINQAKTYNHKVVSVKFLEEKAGVYDLTIDKTHNFALAAGIFVHNSMDGDNAAAQRYTEAKLTHIAEQLLIDIDKDTVDFVDNYDSTAREPIVLPTKIPALLVNGTMGIAVGMATNIPPHNLTEVLDGLVHLIENPEADVADLNQFVKGPDFPTAGIIYNEKDILNAYATGKGPIVMRAKADIVEGKKGFQIVVTEIPYQVNKAELIKKIAELAMGKERKVDGIRDVRDESDKDGVRVVVDLKQDAFPKKVLNQLFKYTELQKTFHINMLALVDGIQPQILGLKGVLEQFIEHRRVVVVRRAKFDLKKAQDRAHILEGLKKALDHIDAIIKLIRASASQEEALKNLMKKFGFSQLQATAILEMKLRALAGLERKKIEDELNEKKKLIAELEALLASTKKILALVKQEFLEIKEKYGDERRTKIIKTALKEVGEEELMPEEDSLFMITRGGYLKRMAPDVLKVQKRGGKGLIGIETKEEDVVSQFFMANTHDTILFFTNSGRAFQVKGYEVPESSRTSKGKAIVNFLNISPSESVTAVVPIAKDRKGMYLFMATKNGVVKKVALSDFQKVRSNGLAAIKLKKDDELKWVWGTSGKDEIMMISSDGSSIRFKESDVRPMGRVASGVIGMRLDGGAKIVGMEVVSESVPEKDFKLLVVMDKGYGKRTDLRYYKVQHRGGRGVLTAKLTPKTGQIISAHLVNPEDKEIIAVSQKGQVIRTELGSISVLSRATQGVRIMRMAAGDSVASVVVV